MISGCTSLLERCFGFSVTGPRADITIQLNFIRISSGTICFHRKEELLGVGPEWMITVELTPHKD